MKKTALVIGLCTLALSASAQFKVQSDGKIAIRNNSTVLSPISINGTGNSSYYISCGNTDGKNGMILDAVGNSSNTSIFAGMFTSVATNQAIGLRGNANYATTNIGVMGNAESGTKKIGLLGNTSSSTGAAVYGTVYGDLGSALITGDLYAGLFRGNVKATGSIVAGTTLQGALLGEASSGANPSANGLSLRSVSVASSLSGLNVTTFQKERPALFEDEETIYKLDGDSTRIYVKPQPDIIDEQFYEKNHYALDADRLEEAFPDLVYVRKDGSKAINYMEMIPLLVQSINELSVEIENLKTQGRTAKAARSTTSNVAASSSQNKLYQNRPNPFKEQAIIRFSLAEGTKDAAICIFDMSGKILKKFPISSAMESVSVAGNELGEGMFLYSLIVNGLEIDTKKMVITK